MEANTQNIISSSWAVALKAPPPHLSLLLAVNAIAGCTTPLHLSHPQLHLSAQGKEIAYTLWDAIIPPWGPLQSVQQALKVVPPRELKKKNKERRKEKETPVLSVSNTLSAV